MKQYYYYETDLGALYIAEDNNAIIEVGIEEENQADLNCIKNETPLIRETHLQLMEYFAGQRQTFQLPLAPKGTPFQQTVWQTLQTIPYGQTWSYLQLAKAIGNPKACRAVGMANHRNPIGIIIPCHRVIGANGSLVGYAGGLDMKKRLLEIENRAVNK